MKPEKDLILDLIGGDIRAFDALYNLYHGKLYNFVYKLSNGDRYMAEEIVQDTFVKIWEKRQSIDLSKSFNSFICTIAKNQLLNHFTHQSIKYIHEEFVIKNSSELDNTTEHQIDFNMLDSYIDTLIEKLPPARKQIFVLSKREGKTNKEISKELGITESTIETQLSKAKSFMKQELIRHYGAILGFLFFFLF